MVSRDIEETQAIPATQEIDMQSPSPLPSLRRVPSLPPSDIRDSSGSFLSTQQIDTVVLQEKLQNSQRNRVRPDSGMSDTRIFFLHPEGTDMTLDIESPIPVDQTIPNIPGRIVKTTKTVMSMEDDGRVDCDCGTMVIRHP